VRSIEVFQAPGAEIINPQHLVPIREKGIHKVTADKT
jgi:hypothetical protein